MTIHEAQSKLMFQLYHWYDDREAANIADLVMENITGWPRVERIFNKKVLMSQPMLERLAVIINGLGEGRPVQYVLNEAWFYGEKFYVDERVLIPRPETEELVAWILAEEKQRGAATLVDIGTGTGCIPITLKMKWKESGVIAIDNSTGALEVAQRNARDLGVEVDFKNIDVLNNVSTRNLPAIDVIVSNPPYIPLEEKPKIHSRVRDHEPASALFVDSADVLVFYRAIAQIAQQNLLANGCVYVETHENYAGAVAEIFEVSGLKSVEIKKDMQGKERMVRGVKREP